MSVRPAPSPRSNRSRAGFIGAADDLAAADILVTTGDEAGGTADDQFTLNGHGLASGDYVFLLYKSNIGAVTGRVGTRFRVAVVSANIFTLKTPAGTAVVNTADGTAIFLKGTHDTTEAYVQNVILPNLIVAAGDFASAAILTDDEFTSLVSGLKGLEEQDPLKLLYKSAAGVVTGISAGTTVYAKGVVPTAFQVSATAGGAVIENSADGTAIFVLTA